MPEYQWRFQAGTPFEKLPEDKQQAVGESVDALREKVEGEELPVALVSDARREDHPCHDLFEWDDAKCGELHRRDQARRIINAITCMVSKADRTPGQEGESFLVSLTVSTPEELVSEEDVTVGEAQPARRYYRTDEVLANEELRQRYLETTVKHVASHLRHVEKFEELEFLVKAVRKAQRLAGLI